MKKVLFPVLLLFFVVIQSCKTDFDINADAKEITVVYGLLDQGETTHFVKITKAFLGEENALIMASDPANSTYGDELEVKVSEYNNGSTTWTVTLKDTLISNKEPGTFYGPDQKVYVFHKTLNENRRYKLNITNKTSGKIITSETMLVKDFDIISPLFYPLNPQIGFVTLAGKYVAGEVKWQAAVDGRLYEPTIRFHYTETNKTTLAVDSTKYVDWKLSSIRSSALDGKETLLISYNGESFYKVLQGAIPVDNNIKRSVGKIDLLLSVGGDEISTYIELNRPSNSIIQERPAFTNISNGIGIFSCRHTKSLKGFALSAPSVTRLFNSEYTSQLGFEP